MFGFSLPKLLVLLAIVLAVIGAFRAFERLNSRKVNRTDDPDRLRKTSREPEQESGAKPVAETLIECPKCGLFRTADSGSCCEEGENHEQSSQSSQPHSQP